MLLSITRLVSYLLVLFSLGQICTVNLIFSALLIMGINITDSNIMELNYFIQVLMVLTYEMN